MNGDLYSTEKDVFFVHTKEDEQQGELIAAVVARLASVGVATWLYEDWDWERKVRRPGRGARRSSGRLEELDHSRYLAGDLQPFNAPIDEIDDGALAHMMHSSKVVVLCEPGRRGPTEGVWQERKVLGGLTRGPILLHVIPANEAERVFAPLKPTAEYQCQADAPPDVVADEVFASISAAWLVYCVQWRFSMYGGGHRLMKAVARLEPSVSKLIEQSPRYEPEEARPRDEALPEPNSISGMFARMESFEVEHFEKWWTELAPLRSIELASDGRPATQAFRGLVAAIDASWRDAFAS